MKRLKIGIIGMGVISHYYVKAFDCVGECELVAVCDLDDARLAAHRRLGRRCMQDFRQLLGHDGIDAVVVNLPNHLHYAVCLAALEHGKHVCCEKPLTLDLAQAQELARFARQRGLTLLTAFHRRYNRHLLAAMSEGLFESAHSVLAHYDERIEDHSGADAWYLDPVACGGGCIADNGPNVLDALCFALGPLRLQAVQARLDVNGVDRGARIDLHTADGRPVRAVLSWDFQDGERKDFVLDDGHGQTRRVDMLAGYEAFKSSLYHEYEGVLRHLHRAVYECPEYGDDGVQAVRLVAECYAQLRAAEVPA